jgi:molybdopterin synthase sulfur carrier subunit
MSEIVVRIPSPLRRLTNGEDRVKVGGTDLGTVITSLDETFPGIKTRLCDDDGALRNFVNIYINGEDVRFLQGLETSTKDGDEVSIVPAVAGGSL